MADPHPKHSVYRYFELQDSFIQIDRVEASQLGGPEYPGMGRDEYRLQVLAACLPGLKNDVGSALTQICPEDPTLAKDMLFQLCLEVNPALSLQHVSLPVEHSSRSAVAGHRNLDSRPPGTVQQLRSRVRDLKQRLAARVLGQATAIEACVRAVRRASAGLSTDGRPLTSLMFCGRTGTGKTELARALSAELFPDQPDKLLRIDCSEYALAHEQSKLTGAPPGFVGHEEGGQLTGALEEDPERILLFDEIEKAHPQMHNTLLQIMEEGSLTDSRGRRVRFDRTLVIMTSNAGASEVLTASESVGFGHSTTMAQGDLESITSTALNETFSPEFLARLDQVLVFQELNRQTAEQIAAKELKQLALRVRETGRVVAFTPGVSQWISERGYSPAAGAREIRRTIQREVESRIADHVLDAELDRGQILRIGIAGDCLKFQVED